ncbi:hypothetical protein BRC81_14630 [Halobacteriales archaeon QS_1_68_20]|nr:MAG: hypothetical protein BRC81_14630 [Halobacteriales archaeon QS_1_68_20]
MSEFAFELALCARLEADREGVVARQLGAGVERPGNRVVDVLVVEPGSRFDERTRLPPERIPDATVESEVGPGRARYWKDAFDCHPERAERAVERAVDIGFFERERRGGREYVRQVARYPDWFGRLIGIENKPDLGDPGDLEAQLRKDVSLGVLDAAVLATESHVTGAHLNRIPDEVGVWRVHSSGRDGVASAEGDVEIEVVREPAPLNVDGPGVELLEEHPGRTEIAVVDADRKARARRRLAERAYGKGWRTYDFPDCAEVEPANVAGSDGLPYCAWKGRLVDAAAECGPDCPGYADAEPPDVDLDAERAARSSWNRDPEGRARRQAGLDRFGE